MDTIYIAFTGSDLWHKVFLKKGFGHCCVLIAMENGWLQIDPTHGALQFKHLTDNNVSYFTKLLRVKLPTHYKFTGFSLKFVTCVTIIEYMLGKRMYSITPYRLYEKLTGKFKKTFKTQEIF